MSFTITDIARACHELNRGYCCGMGDTSQPQWFEAPDWQQSSAIEGVVFHLNNPEADDAASHNNWLKGKQEAGWVYGPVKDEHALTHPCMVPFEKLPRTQQIKDKLFRQTVHALAPLLD